MMKTMKSAKKNVLVREKGPKTMENWKEKKHLIYTEKFKRFVRRNRFAINEFMEARKRNTDVYVSKGGKVVVTKLRRNGNIHRKIWRVDVGKKTFFVKETGPIGSKARNGQVVGIFDLGPPQFRALDKLREYETRHVKVANYGLGWRDREKSFLVTDFYELKKIDLDRIPKWLKSEVQAFMFKALDQIGILDIVERNMFYDPAKKIVIVFDPR